MQSDILRVIELKHRCFKLHTHKKALRQPRPMKALQGTGTFARASTTSSARSSGVLNPWHSACNDRTGAREVW